MPTVLAIGAAIASVLASMMGGPPAVTTAPVSTVPPEGVWIDIVSAFGSGCTAGTATIAISPDNDSFLIRYSAFHAQVGVGAAPVDFRKNCQLSARIYAPAGYSYAISGVDHFGWAGLAAGASSTVRTLYYFSGQTPSTTQVHRFEGPFDDNWQTTDEIDIASLVFSPCGAVRNLNINSELRVNAGTSDRATTNSSMIMDATASNVYRLVWRQCD